MWYLLSTEKWLDEVIRQINEKQLKPEESKFMIAFFSSMDEKFVTFFKNSKDQISSFSGKNFHIFTPLIYDNKIIPDENWRFIRHEFISYGIPLRVDPTFIFFKLETQTDGSFEPKFFAGFDCLSFKEFPKKLKYAIDICINTDDIKLLQEKLSVIFSMPNIIPVDNINNKLKQTFINKFPKAKIFISHSTKDKPFARQLVSELSQDTNLNFWIDEREIIVGDDIQQTITENLKQSDFLFLIISKDSTKSNWVNFEISQYIGFTKGKNIIPIIISKDEQFPEPIDNFIRRLKYLDFSDNKKWNENIQELKQRLSSNKEKNNIKITKNVTFNNKVENAIVGNNNKVIINKTKKIIQKYPEGSIGFDTIKANYIGHLIARYNEYKEYEVGKEQIKYYIFGSQLKKHFKIAPTRTIYNLHIDKFDELVSYIQLKINNTKLAKIKGKNHKNYSTFEEFEKRQK